MAGFRKVFGPTQWSFKKWKSNLHEVNKQGQKIQHERGETGSQQEIASLGRNGNKQQIIQVCQEQESLQRNETGLLAPQELKGTIKEDEDTAEK